jgi:hypothetical protein
MRNITFLFLLTFFNWFFEILKWKSLVSPVIIISFKKAVQQCLGALTASLLTPNRIGEYGAKAIYFKSANRKQIMLINLFGNMSQMAVTTLFGIIGIYFFMENYPLYMDFINQIQIIVMTIFTLILIIYGIHKSNIRIQNFTISKLKSFIIHFPKKILLTSFLLSLSRYLIFSFQFYYLLHVFGVNLSYFESMTIISTMYFLASVIPSFFIFDVIIKGSIAVYLFSFSGVNDLIVISVVTLMWLFNVVLPSIVGSYHVLHFNLPKND